MHLRHTVAAVGCFAAMSLPQIASADTTTCRLTFSLGGWSEHFEQSSGRGTIVCENGQRANVTVIASGSTLRDGAGAIAAGSGDFSAVLDISAILGAYVLPPAAAYAKRKPGGAADAMTNGQASLTFPLDDPSARVPGTFKRFSLLAR